MRLLLCAVLLVACSKGDEPAAYQPSPSLVPATELKRGRDACAAYVAQVCKCAETMPALVKQCQLARPLPEALEVDQSVGTAPGVDKKDAVSLAVAVRKTIKTCIDETAKLPAAGCR